MSVLLTNIAQVATPLAAPQRGARQGDLRLIEDAALLLDGERIAWVGRRADFAGRADEEHDLGGAAVVPALVDPHTHAVWAGDRLADFEARARGESYEAILARGGGLRHTARETAGATVDDLVALARPRLAALVRSGAATIEVKSGYGLAPEAELRMLEAIARLAGETPATLVPTLLLHVPPPGDRAAFVEEVCRDLVPEVARRGLARAVDVFVEREAFTVEEADAFLGAARAHGLAGKLHADQFHAVGGVELAVRRGALSVDHLEASGADQWRALDGSDTVATLLPGVTLHLGLPAANGRALLAGNAIVALGSDLNPGSSPLFSAALTVALGVRLCGLTPAEALVAGTANAAAALGLRDRGIVAPGARADLAVLAEGDWRALPYTLGGGAVEHTWIGGRRTC